MAQAARAYRYPERAPERGPRIRVVPGKGIPTKADTLSPSLVMLAKMFAVFVVIMALLGFVRIGLASATVSTAVATEELSTQIENAHASANSLEVTESYLSNPVALKGKAAGLGMAEAAETGTLTLPKDVIVTDASGNLSLSGSLKAASQGL